MPLFTLLAKLLSILRAMAYTRAMDKADKPTDKPAGDRIAKVLARAGVASRREAERMIEAGRVTVNGEDITSPALNVTASDRITVDGAPLAEAEPERMWLYHKPLGLVTSNSDEKGRTTVFDELPDDLPRVMSVGRLDINSEGLLLLTNDGGIKRKLELPATGWVRKYRVRVNGRPTDDTLAPLRGGVVSEGEKFQPMQVSIDRQQGANAWLTVGIREGKNREIRRAMEVVGLTVNRLIRISYGPFRLGDLKPGDVEEIKSRVLREQLGMEPRPQPTRTRKPVGAPGAPAAHDKPRGKLTGKPGQKPRQKPGGKFAKPNRRFEEDYDQQPSRARPARGPRKSDAKSGRKPTGRGAPTGRNR